MAPGVRRGTGNELVEEREKGERQVKATLATLQTQLLSISWAARIEHTLSTHLVVLVERQVDRLQGRPPS